MFSSSLVRKFFGVVMIICANIVVLGFPQHVLAATFTVNSTADTTDDVIGDGICADANGNCTLRAALMEHDTFGTTDTIILPAGTYTLTITGTGEDSSATGDLDIGPSGTLTFTGSGAQNTIIDANGIDRVIDIKRQTPVTPPVVSISGITVKNGSISSANGGGIYIHKSGVGGGGGPSVTLTDVQILSNTVSNGSGGGIYTDSNSGLSMTRVTVANNTASGTGEGGGLSNYSNNGTFRNITISGNSAGSGGGGGIIDGNDATYTNVTVYNNSATTGAGLYVVSSTSTFLNTLLVNNGSNNCANSGSTITSQGHNISTDSSCSSILTASGDLNNQTVNITSTLAYNGGTTQSHALPEGSQAIDKGANDGCPATDQRGVTRPQDGNNDGLNFCDPGAYEFQYAPPGASPTPTPNPNSCGDSMPSQVTNVYVTDGIPNDGRVTVQWVPPGNAGQAHIRYGEQDGVWNYSLLNTVNDGIEIISGLGLGRSYYFQVAAVNGCRVGPYSASFGPVPGVITYGTPLPNASLTPSPSSFASISPLPSGLLPPPSEFPIANIIPIPQTIPPMVIPLVSATAAMGFGIAALGMLASGSTSLVTGISVGLSAIYHGFDELISLLLSYFGIIKRRRKSLGVVFDALSNTPLAHAYIVLHSPSGNLKTTFTNRDGRFQISAPADTYILTARLNGYDFPSTIITVSENQQYAHIYLPNEEIKITDQIVANIAIPLDPTSNEFSRFFHRLSNQLMYILFKTYDALFILLTIFLAVNVWYRPSLINKVALTISVASLFLNWLLSFCKSQNWGVVKDQDGKPMPGITVKLFHKGDRLDLYTSTQTDGKGRYLFTPENGEYEMQIIDDNGQAIYQKDVVVSDNEPKVSLSIMI